MLAGECANRDEATVRRMQSTTSTERKWYLIPVCSCADPVDILGNINHLFYTMF
jgi:hypothetical protein